MFQRFAVTTRSVGPSFACLLVLGSAEAAEIPDAAVNPISGSIELTEAVLDAGQFQIRYVEHPDGGEPGLETILSESDADDLGPRIDVNSAGDTSIVWWRESTTPEVVYRSKDVVTGAWSVEKRVSAEGEIAVHPELAHDGSTTWIVYEAPVPSGTQLMITNTDDGPEPIPLATAIATSTYAGSLDLAVRAESGHVWVSWIDAATAVAWSQCDTQTQTWSPPQSESTVQASLAEARAAIRATVLGN